VKNDRYAEQGWIPPSVLLGEGRLLCCDECDRRSDDEEDPWEPTEFDPEWFVLEEFEYDRLRGPVVHHEHGRWYFCSAYCKAEFLESMEEARKLRET
jgi:hypothetical protein